MTKRETLGDWFAKHMPASRPQFTEDHFQPYVQAIGQLLLVWNDLHERLGTLFAAALGRQGQHLALAIWHKTRMDLAKRELLKTTIENISVEETQWRPKLLQEIMWILSVAKQLEGFRDDSAHGPLQDITFQFLSDGAIHSVVVPNTFFGNPRALRLTDADLLGDFNYSKERTLVLRDYVIAIEFAWSNAHVPWPDRPVLPNRGNKKVVMTTSEKC